MRIAVLGPAAPKEFVDNLNVPSGDVPAGMVGTPVNGLVRGLLDLGHHVSLITASPDTRVVWRASGPQMDLVVVPYRPRARSRALDLFAHERSNLAAELRRATVDVVSAHWSYEYGWPAVTSDVPHLLTVHDAPLTILRHLPDPYRLLRTIMAYRVRYSARNISAVSPYLAAAWKRQMLYPRHIAVIPNIVPDLPSVRTESQANPVLLDIADGSSRKNVRALLRAFPAVLETYPSAELRLIGPGLGASDPIALWARSVDLDKQVTSLGAQTRRSIAWHLDQATVFCHSSLEESQPMILLEAMSENVPIVAGASSGGVPWTLDNGSAGLLVDVRRPDEISGAAVRLLNDSALRNRLVEAGRSLVQSRYSRLSVAQQYVVQLEKAVTASRLAGV